MQIYCLNDDRGLAGFMHLRTKIQRKSSLLRKMDVFDQKGRTEKKWICMRKQTKRDFKTDVKIRGDFKTQTETSKGGQFTKI